MHEFLQELLEKCVARQASDLHLSSGRPAYLRQDGGLKPITEQACTAMQVQQVIDALLSDQEQQELERRGALDIAFDYQGVRFRGHVYRQQTGWTLAARQLQHRFQTLSELGLPTMLGRLSRLRDGLVLLTGPTGSGKSTTLATLIHMINQERACHILTIEDPVEYVHADQRSLVHQREVGRDVVGFADAVRDALREDPDVVLVGEMRDVDTMRSALVLAETGHLVFSTLHCGSAVGALDRMIGVFPAHERTSLCQQLSMTLRAVVVQHLLPHRTGGGRVPALEVLRVTSGVAHLIRQHKSEQLASVMEGGQQEGMLTLDQSLAELVRTGTIAPDTAESLLGETAGLKRRLRVSDSGGKAFPGVRGGR